MLMAVKNQLRVCFLSIKYALVREMLNKTTFITNIIFMILNNLCFIVQWVILFSLKDNVGGYSFKQVLLLWGFAATTFGISHFFFKDAYNLSDIINKGKLDAYLIQPKNVLLTAITSSIDVSAIGDIIYGFIMLFLYGISFKSLFLFVLFSVTGALILTSISVIFSSLSFWFSRVEILPTTMNNLMTNFATYPDGIFKGTVKILLFSLIPVGFVNFIPVHVMSGFNMWLMLGVVFVSLFLVALAFIIFNKGLKKYSSSSLMSARI